MELQTEPTKTAKRTKKAERYGLLALTANKRGVYLEIPKEDLQVDPDYQRKFVKQAKVAAIVKDFHWCLFGALQVATRPDGSFWIIEGQNRYLAAMKIPDIDTLPCIVYEMASKADEAASFLHINTSRDRVTAIDQWDARITARDPFAIKMTKILAEHGITVTKTNASNTVECVGVLAQVASRDWHFFTKLVPLLKAIHQGAPWRSHIISGLDVIARSGNEELMFTPRIMNRLAAFGSVGLLQSINQARAHNGGRGNPLTYAIGIVNLVNKNLRGDRFGMPIQQ